MIFHDLFLRAGEIFLARTHKRLNIKEEAKIYQENANNMKSGIMILIPGKVKFRSQIINTRCKC